MNINIDKQAHLEHHADLCVVGGGLAGMFTAISAARHGAHVVLMQDRPVLGGNCSSEIRMWVRGATASKHTPEYTCKRETGLISELEEENIYVNPNLNFSLWDATLWNMVKAEPNITLLLNCSCADAEMKDGRVASVTGWQLTTYTWHTVYAAYFADCSGDSVLAPITGARYRVGREGNDEFHETIGPRVGDRKTMGMSCLIQARETDHPVTFKAPKWANVYLSDDDFEFAPDRATENFEHCSAEARKNATKMRRTHTLATSGTNFWWLELGGEDDSIYDTETLRDELIKTAYGIWDHIKNHGDHGADNWELEWIGFLPGKRESRRYVGRHVLTQNDVEAEGRHFPDIVAYGGWQMDDHNPAGFRATVAEPPSLMHPTPSPYGIPLRALYSGDIPNLLFAGRNLSATHAAMSSTRVMATCSLLGQALGTAAAMCINENIDMDTLVETRIEALRTELRDDGCWLPFSTREIPALSREARLSISDDERELLFNGLERPDEQQTVNYITLPVGGELTFEWDSPRELHELRVMFDLDFSRMSVSPNKKMRVFAQKSCTGLDFEPVKVASTLVKRLRVEADGREIYSADELHHSLFRLPLDVTAQRLTLHFDETWGAEDVHLFSCDVK